MDEMHSTRSYVLDRKLDLPLNRVFERKPLDFANVLHNFFFTARESKTTTTKLLPLSIITFDIVA